MLRRASRAGPLFFFLFFFPWRPNFKPLAICFVIRTLRFEFTRVQRAAMIMSVPKLSRRVGDWILKELSRGEAAPIIRAGHVQRSYSQYLKPLFGRQTERNMFQGALFQKHHHFSTITADTASEVESEENKKISVTFIDKEGEEKQILVPLGMSMLEAALENDMELEGACEGSLACSTCHVIVMDTEYYSKLEDPTDEENDMLDLAFGLSETSRLGCQVIAKPELDGIRLAIPTATGKLCS